jgi:hypothetical protein
MIEPAILIFDGDIGFEKTIDGGAPRAFEVVCSR